MAEEFSAKSTSGVSFSTPRGGATVEDCEKMIRKSLENPMVKFLIKHLNKAGCEVKDSFIRAVHCDVEVSGGYVSGEGIIVCSNHMTFQDDVNQVVIHELIHAFDECRASNLDWTNCAHHACSEIRAGHLSGDCHFKRELLRGFLRLRGHGQECVKRRVMKSLIANPYCTESTAREAMDEVWETCYNDTKPFDRAP